MARSGPRSTANKKLEELSKGTGRRDKRLFLTDEQETGRHHRLPSSSGA